MQINATYRSIWNIAYPIMVGSLAQNLIGLTDIVFLGRLSEVELGAAGYMAIYYLVLVMMGFGISRGGQILIARRAGEAKYDAIGSIFYNLLYVEGIAAFVFFLFMQFLSPWVLHYFISSPNVYTASNEYLFYRSFGIFFSLFGFVLMALYTGIGRNRIIAIVTAILFIVNAVLNYALVFGKLGLPAMGIGGSGLASSLAEVVSTIFGIGYLFYDKKLAPFGLNHFRKIDSFLVKTLTALSLPIMFQYLIGFGGWFLLFSFIESLGERALAVSSLLKNVYTFYSIPAWGFASAVNALVSNLIGQDKNKIVPLAINRTTVLSVIMTIAVCATLVIFPQTVLGIFTNDQNVINGALPILFMLLGIILAGSVSTVIFNGVMGTGNMFMALGIEMAAVAIYLFYTYIVTSVMHLDLPHVWAAEFLYWMILGIPSWIYLQSGHWRRLKV